MAWLYEFDEIVPRRRSSGGAESLQEAVDRLMAIDWQ
jgi:hypothetical protein